MSSILNKAVILLGVPGSGKGTQAGRICKHYGFTHISTGDMLRESAKTNTKSGRMIFDLISKGLLVPDEVILEIMKQRLQEDDLKGGILTDGFPRTLNQATEFDNLAIIERVINIEVDYSVLSSRICGRRVCSNCGKVYHISKHFSNLCSCNGELYIRNDDTEETLKTRYEQYLRLTAPLKDYYLERKKLYSIDGDADEDTVFNRIKQILG